MEVPQFVSLRGFLFGWVNPEVSVKVTTNYAGWIPGHWSLQHYVLFLLVLNEQSPLLCRKLLR